MPGTDDSAEASWDGPVAAIDQIKIMPKEFGEQQPSTEHVHYASREERKQYARDLINSGQVKVDLSAEFLNSPMKDDILAAVLTNPGSYQTPS